MFEIKTLDDVRGNNVVIYSIKTLLDKGTYPHFSILAGNMGVGKSSVAKLVAAALNRSESDVKVFNFGLDINMSDLENDVFKLNPALPRAFIFEELHGLNKSEQTALLTMIDKQPQNIYIIATTTEVYKILRTIRSRATVWDFKLLSERQLSQLLDDYLLGSGANISKNSKFALLKAARGVPRDLLKMTDLAISGDFQDSQLSSLLGQISEDVIFALLCSLKSSGIDFATNITSFIDESGDDKLYQLRDFFTRFLLERRGIEGATLTREKISTLNSLFDDEELTKIGRTLVRATRDTLLLDLSLLNMELTKTSNKQIISQQQDRLASRQAAAVSRDTSVDSKQKLNNARVSLDKLHNVTL